MQLLKITTVPIKYKEQEIPAENNNAVFSVDMAEKNAANVQIPVAGTQNSRNSTEMYDESVVGVQQPGVQRKADAMVHETASETDSVTYKVDSRFGEKNRVAEQRQNVSSFLRNNVQKAVTLDSAMDSIDSVLPDKSWEPEAKTKTSQIHAPTPESPKIVEEFAHVEIEYLGGFNYVPKSSAPDYEEPEE